MNRSEIIFPHETSDCFIRRCMNDKINTNQSLVDECAAKSENVDEFIDSFLSHAEEISSQFYCVLLKKERPERVFYAIRHHFGDRQFKTISDGGAVRVGNDSFSILVPNGHGDGVSRVAIFDGNEFVLNDLMDYFTNFSAQTAHVYDYDCSGGVPMRDLSGEYAIFYAHGFVAFVRR